MTTKAKNRIAGLLTVLLTAIAALTAGPASAVVGGSPAAPAQFPYQVSIRVAGSHICGGSILTATSVVTAAHCAEDKRSSVMSVAWGGTNRFNLPNSSAVSQIRIDPAWNSGSLVHDVAVLTLASPITFGANAQPIPLATVDPAVGTAVTVSGWGRTVGGGEVPTTLQYATLNTLSNAACDAKWQDVNSITSSMLCAQNRAASACNGDSGGPLAANGQLVGIVSWGANGCPANTTVRPAVFADVVAARSWILANANAPVTRTASAAPTASADDEPGVDHGCPRDVVCLYATDAHYQNNQPDAVDDLRTLNVTDAVSIPGTGYAEVVNNSYTTPEYSAEGTITLGLLGLCVFVPEDTESSGTDTQITGLLGENTVITEPTAIGADSLTIPCPAN